MGPFFSPVHAPCTLRAPLSCSDNQPHQGTWSRVEKGSVYTGPACWPPCPMMPSSWFPYFQYSPVSFAPTGLVNLAESSRFWTSELHRKCHLLLICMSSMCDGGETTKHLTLNVFTSPCEWDHHRDTEGVKKGFRDDITDIRGRRLSQFGHLSNGRVWLSVIKGSSCSWTCFWIRFVHWRTQNTPNMQKKQVLIRADD